MKQKPKQVDPIQLETFLNILFAEDSDYIFTAQVLAAMKPEGW